MTDLAFGFDTSRIHAHDADAVIDAFRTQRAGESHQSGIAGGTGDVVGTVAFAGDAGYGVKVDVWGLGMCCKEMAEGMPLFHDLTPMQALFRLAEPDFTAGLDNPASFSVEFSLFVGMCLKSRPEERASSAQLLDHIFVDEVDPLLPSDL